MRILIIAHPKAGVYREKRQIIERIAAHITGQGGSADITYIMKPGMGNKHSSHAAIEGYDAVYAAGGDGTVNDVASGLVGRKTPLGIVPLGSGNGFARALGIPFDTEDILHMFETRKTRQIDVGRVSNRFFFSCAGIGYDAFIASEFNRLEAPDRTVKSLWKIAIKEYLRHSSETVAITIDGREEKRKIFGLTIANTGHYGAGAVISPDSDMSDGTLEAILIPRFNPISGWLTAKKLFNGGIEDVKKIERIPFSSLKIKRNRPGICHVDGETFSVGNTVTVSVDPSALTVIVP